MLPEFVEGFDAVYGAWSRILPGLDVGLELETGWQERTVEVDRLDRPGRVDASSDQDVFEFSVGPSARWRIFPDAEVSPVLRAHAGYVRTRTTHRDDTGDYERTADGAVVRVSAGAGYQASEHLDVVLGLAARWSLVEGEVLFHANETSRTTRLDLLTPTATFVIRF